VRLIQRRCQDQRSNIPGRFHRTRGSFRTAFAAELAYEQNLSIVIAKGYDSERPQLKATGRNGFNDAP
jgi:hypothetical protein